MMYLKKNLFLFFAVITAIIAALSARNFFGLDPAGIISLGDFFELPNYADISRYSYAIFDHNGKGMGNPLVLSNWYYEFLNWFYSIDFIYAHRFFYYITTFYLGMYLVFWLGMKLTYKNLNIYHYFYILFLVFNPLTLGFFRYSWGFTHYILQYIGIAVLLIGYIGILLNIKKIEKIQVFTISVFSGIILFFTITNIAFLALALIIMGIMSGIKLLETRLYDKWLSIHLCYSVFMVPVVILLAYYFIQIQGEFISTVKENSSYGGDVMGFIKAYSSSVFNTFFFDLKTPHSKLSFIGIIPVILLLLSLLKYKASKVTNLYFLIIPFLILFVLSTRIAEPFVSINTFIYDSIIGSFIRSADKVAFLYTIILVSILGVFFQKKSFKIPNSYSLSFFLLFIVFQSLIYPSSKDEIFDKKGVDMYVNIPGEYQLLNDSLGSGDRVLSLPYNVSVSPGWDEHPQWNQRGSTILSEISKAEWVSANSSDYPSTGLFAFKKCPKNKADLYDKSIDFYATHLIVHKDINSYFTQCSREIINAISVDEDYSLIENNPYYSLYSIDTTYKYETTIVNPSKHIITTDQSEYEFMHPYSYSKHWKIIGDIPYSKEFVKPFSEKYILTSPKKSITLEYIPQKTLNIIYNMRILYIIIGLFLLSGIIMNYIRKEKS